MRACAGVIAAPASEAARVRAIYGIDPGRIFNPVDTDAWTPDDGDEARSALAIPQTASVVVWHGRVAIDKKGLDVLLDAWERLCRARSDDDLRLLLVGTGDDAAALARRLTGVGETVVWIDRFVNDPAVARRYLCAGDVYIFASRYEGFPVAPIEAMACGLPVVATDVEGARELLRDGEAGLIVPPNDPQALASAVGRLLDDPDRRRALGERARRRAESQFSLEATGQSLRAFLGVDPA
jgi:starch synthase